MVNLYENESLCATHSGAVGSRYINSKLGNFALGIH